MLFLRELFAHSNKIFHGSKKIHSYDYIKTCKINILFIIYTNIFFNYSLFHICTYARTPKIFNIQAHGILAVLDCSRSFKMFSL